MNDTASNDPRLYAIPDIHGHAKGEHKAFSDERPIPLSARMLFLWFYHACRRGWPRFLMVTDHMNYLTFEDPAAINLVRRALKLAQAGDLYGAAETASVEVGHAAVVSEGLRRGMRYSIGAEVDNDPRSRPDAQNIVDAMKPDGMIRSVHFLTIDHPAHGPNWNWPFDNPEFADVYDTVGTAKTWELYMAALLDAIERLPGNILGHFYVPAAFGHWPDDATLDAYENQIVDACEARGMAIEFNTRFLYRDHSEEEKAKYLAAHRRLLAKCKAKNVGIAVGSDAHSPKDQGRGFETVLALLDECEINELVFPIAGRLARVALRVERKVEAVSEHASAPEERRAARKARPSETSGRDEVSTAPRPVDDPPGAPKVKPRPKRSKAKPSGVSSLLDPESGSSDFTGVESEVAVTITVHELSQTAPPVEPELVVVVAESIVSDPVEEIVAEPDFEPIVFTAVPEPAVPEPAAAVPAAAAVFDDSLAEDSALDDAELEAAGPDEAAFQQAALDVSALEESAREELVREELVREELVREELVREELAREEPVREELGREETALEDGPTEHGAAGDEVPETAALHDRAVIDQEWEGESAEAEAEPVPEPLETVVVVEPAASAARKPAKSAPGKARAAAGKPKVSSAKTRPAVKKTAKAGAKAPAKKPAAKKAPAKKIAAKKASAKKSAAKITPVKKAPAKKAAVRTPGTKKSSAKKSAAKKVGPKKPAQRRR